MHRGHLLGIGKKRLCLRGPYHDRRDQIAGARRIVVEHAEDVVCVEAEPEFLLNLAQRCRDGVLAFLAAPARQRVLTFVGAQVAPAPRQHESRLARSVLALHQDYSNGSTLEATRRIECRRARERRAAARHQATEGLIERVEHSA